MVRSPGTAIVARASSSQGHATPGNNHRTVPVAHAGAARTEDVAVAQVGIGVNAQRRQLQLAFQGAAVERLNVDQLVREAIGARRRSCPGPGHRT